MRRLFVAGNWKMNSTLSSSCELAEAIAKDVPDQNGPIDVAVCPPFPYLTTVGEALSGSGVDLGAQNAYHENPGAFTGEVAIEMLQDVGCRWVILGHSERRHVLGENDELINQKVTAALTKGIDVILCVGEQLSQRENGQTEAVLDEQMEKGLAGVQEDAFAHLVIAYEPVWAIGTGKTATPEQADSAHDHLRKWLANRYNSTVSESARILYGGSVKPDNAQTLLQQPNVDGALVGGASLKADSFLPIIQAANQVAQQ